MAGVVLGTMEMGRNQCIENVPKLMVDEFMKEKDLKLEIDTALMYCGGKTEKILGKHISVIEKNKGYNSNIINTLNVMHSGHLANLLISHTNINTFSIFF